MESIRCVQKRGYLKARGDHHRPVATHVCYALCLLSRLEQVAETRRSDLNAVAEMAPDWLNEVPRAQTCCSHVAALAPVA